MLCGGNAEGITFVTAICVPDKVRADTAQIGISSLAVLILSDEHDVVIRFAFIEPSRLYTKIDQFTVDPTSGKIIHGANCASTGFWEQQFF